MAQPPSGGCVLKQDILTTFLPISSAATFGWLCVETILLLNINWAEVAATFGWLCVETRIRGCRCAIKTQPPSGGCVLKLIDTA